MKAIGAKSPKKIIPSTIGLTIIPSRNPKRIHSLLSGKRISSLIMVKNKNINDVAPNVYAHEKFAAL